MRWLGREHAPSYSALLGRLLPTQIQEVDGGELPILLDVIDDRRSWLSQQGRDHEPDTFPERSPRSMRGMP